MRRGERGGRARVRDGARKRDRAREFVSVCVRERVCVKDGGDT